jgi:hypothetical protein
LHPRRVVHEYRRHLHLWPSDGRLHRHGDGGGSADGKRLGRRASRATRRRTARISTIFSFVKS